MKWIDKPALAFEEVETLSDTGSICWVAGQHKWLPATIEFNTHAEFMDFIIDVPSTILGFEFENINITAAVSTREQHNLTFTFEHARIL